jgi:hypothetical protein
MDDTDRGGDEVADSRTHQFFAFDHQVFDFSLPNWISEADVERAIANQDVTPEEVSPDDVLESSTQWPAQTWMRITPDEGRLPITLEQAAMGVDWDISAIPVGTYVVAAYTWEPKSNLWSFRFGLIKIVDGQDGPPAAFLQAADLSVELGETLRAPGCIDAMEGSTYTASWGVLEGVLEPTWTPFIVDEPIASGPFELEFTPPDELTGMTVKLKIDLTDPTGRTYTAFSPKRIPVTGDPPPSPDEPGCGCRTSRSPLGFAVHSIGFGIVLVAVRRRRGRS